MRLWKYIFLTLLLMCQQVNAVVTKIVIDGPITPTSLEYLSKSITYAQDTEAKALLIQLNTPGGLLSTTQDIVKDMLACRIPVIVYVAPQGAHAASAGTFLVYASDIAAMAPGTRLGAATPVAIGAEKDNAMIQKATEDTAAWIRSLAELKDRAANFGEAAVKDAKSITAREALQNKVVEYIAVSDEDLLNQIIEHPLKDPSKGKSLTLEGEAIQILKPTLKMRILSFLADPNIAYLLLLAGLYGIFFEMMNPGSLFPGVIGAICLTIAAYSLYILPINITGIILIVLGVLMLVAELLTSGIGVLAIGGVIAILAGGFFMINRAQMSMGIALDVLIGSGVCFGILIGATMLLFVRSRNTPLVNGLIGLGGTVTIEINPTGEILVKGERWQATADSKILKGEEIVVVSQTDLTLHVEKK